MDGNLFSAKMFSDVVIAGSFQAFAKNSAYIPPERYNDYVRVTTPMKGPHGHQIYTLSGIVRGSGSQFIITQKAERKVPDIMRWLDAHFETRRSLEISLGPIGVTLEEKPNGIIGYKPTPPGTNYNEFRYGNCPVNGPFYIAPDAWGKIIEPMEEDLDRIDWVRGELAPYLTQWSIYGYPVAEETAFIQNRGQEIDSYVRINQAKWLTQGGIENDWSAYLARLQEMGVNDYIRVMQNQVDRFMQYLK
jgi:putative aldouronate transport system substrate-binding protein